jgi:DNA-binding protein H-NS
VRKLRDFDAKLKALGDKARDLKSRKVQRLGELVIAAGADALSAEELAGALIALAETKEAGKREAWTKREAAFFQSGARRSAPAPDRDAGGAAAQQDGISSQGRGMTCAHGRSSAASARGMIELGGLVVKSGIVALTGVDRAIILGALLWIADKLKGDQRERARQLWTARGKQAFEADQAPHKETGPTGAAVHR